MKAHLSLGLLALLTLAACAGTEVPLHFWPPDEPVRPFLDRPEGTDEAMAAQPERRLEQYVVLLPEEDGSVGVIEVTSGEQTAQLDQPYQAVGFDNLDETYFVEAPQVEASDVSPALSHEPPSPATYVVYFELDSTRMTAASRAPMEQALADIRRRAAPQVWLFGHADRAGDEARNLRLSRQRAEAVAALLQQVGVAAEVMTTRAYGEQQPLVATDDGVREPRNRRVVITIR